MNAPMTPELEAALLGWPESGYGPDNPYSVLFRPLFARGFMEPDGSLSAAGLAWRAANGA